MHRCGKAARWVGTNAPEPLLVGLCSNRNLSFICASDARLLVCACSRDAVGEGVYAAIGYFVREDGMRLGRESRYE